MKKLIIILCSLIMCIGLAGCRCNRAIEIEKKLIENNYDVQVSKDGKAVFVMNTDNALQGWLYELPDIITYHNNEIHSINIDPRTGDYSESKIFDNGSKHEALWNYLDPNATDNAKIELKKESEELLEKMELNLDDIIEMSEYKIEKFRKAEK